MDLGNTVQFNSLKWVKEELRLLLKEAQRQFEQFLESEGEDSARLDEVAAQMSQVRGTLSLVEVYGAALLSEEIEALTEAIKSGSVSNKDDANEAFLRAIFQLNDYLDGISAGQPDAPLRLMPLLNDLRAVRKASLLSENMLFLPDIDDVTAGGAVGGAGTGQSAGIAKKMRPQYQFGLLNWFRETDVPGGLGRMLGVLEKLREVAVEDKSARLWWIASGMVDALRDESVESGVTVKSLMGQVDRQIKALIDLGEAGFAEQVPPETVKNLLYYIAQSGTVDGRVGDIKKAFRLEELMPAGGDQEGQVTGPNEELLNAVSDAIKEDMHQAKDILDLHGPSKNLDALSELPAVMRKIGDTLGMLGLGSIRERVVDLAHKLEGEFGQGEVGEISLMDAAQTLLSAEDTLDALVSNRGGSAASQAEAGASDQAAENRKVVSTVVKEAQKDMAKAKEAIIDYLGDDTKLDKLQQVPELLDSISGAMFVEPLQPVKELISSLKSYLSDRVLKARSIPSESEQEAIADLITSIEYFMEAVGENRDDGALYIAVGEEALGRLGGAPSAETITAEPFIDQAGEAEGESAAEAEEEPVAERDVHDEEPEPEPAGAPSPEPAEQQTTETKPAAAVKEPFERDLDIISEDVDEEILEIFIEEALEELERISTLFPRWRRSPDDSEAITTIRRSFHTLKGSGRLVGAQLIGEFGWSIENMLNRLLDETIDLSDDLYNVVEETIGILPQLVEQLTGNKEPIDEAYDLMARAWAIAEGRDPATVDQAPTEAAQSSEESIEAEPVREPEPQADEGADAPAQESGTAEASGLGEDQETGGDDAIEFDWSDDDDLDADALPDIEMDEDDGDDQSEPEDEADLEPSFSLSDDEMDLEDDSPEGDELDDVLFGELEKTDGSAQAGSLDTDLDAVFDDSSGDSELKLDSADLGEEGLDDGDIDFPLAGDESEGGEDWDLPEMDPVLVDIYSRETLDHIATVEEILDGLESDEQLENTHALTRALHTIHGSSRTAEMHAVADVARRLEYHGNDQEALEENWPAASVALLREAMAAFRQALECLADGEKKRPDLKGLLSRIDPLAEESAARVEANERGQPNPFDQGAADSEAEVSAASAVESEESQASAAPQDTASIEEETITVDTTDELVEIFLEEGEELVDECDATLQRCEDQGFSEAEISELQRQMHTLKGGARMAELTFVGDLSHALEELVIGIQNGDVEADDLVKSTLRQAGDQLAAMIQEVSERGQLTSAKSLVSRLERMRSGETLMPEAGEAPAEPSAQIQEPEQSQAEAEPGQAPSESRRSADQVIEVDLQDDLVDIFLEEGEELVQACDNALHEWESNDFNQAQAEELQRHLHTLKGGARMAGLTPVGDLSHALEELILSIEQGKVTIQPSTVEELKTVVDTLNDMLVDIRQNGRVVSASDRVERLQRLIAGESLETPDAPRAETPEPESPEGTESKGDTQGTGDSTSVATVEEDPNAKRFADAAAPAAMTGTIADQVRVRSDRLDSLVNSAGEVSVYHSRLHQQLGGFGFNLNELEQTVERIREQVRQVSIETDAQIDSRFQREQENPYDDFDPLEMDRYSHMQQLSRSLMESVNDLEDLRDTMSNMVRDSETLLHQQQRISTDLQEGLMSTRMVRFDGITSRLRRIVRQTAQQLDKKAQMEFSGVENEIDRSVQERMLAPLEHMLRNAVSHGIESPAERSERGKPEEGTINLKIGRDGSYIVLTLSDDGGGIDVKRIRAKAVERGLMREDDDKPDQEVMQYILHTGFSTADQVTQISGRGVGMDVVNSEIKHLGGSLRIDSELGKGTTFVVRLPLTLAINQALLVNAGEDTYAIPLTAIEGVARVRGSALAEQYESDRPVHSYAGEEYDIFYLPSLLRLGVPGALEEDEQYPLLLIRAGERRVAIHADELLGRREIVVKPVGRQVSTLPGISGATILDDGRVALILEVGGLVQGDVVMVSLAEDIGETEQEVKEKRKLVMVVDDSITIRKVSARFLERNNYEVVTAKDGMDAVAQLQDVRPDVMLLDIEMPRMDGYEVATHVRATDEIKDLPIIMITSRTGEKHRERAMNIGVNRYLGKPFQEEQLLEQITDLIG
ncbi:MAG: Hpt domain-containing protein [Pseudomonadota bacterium]